MRSAGLATMLAFAGDFPPEAMKIKRHRRIPGPQRKRLKALRKALKRGRFVQIAEKWKRADRTGPVPVVERLLDLSTLAEMRSNYGRRCGVAENNRKRHIEADRARQEATEKARAERKEARETARAEREAKRKRDERNARRRELRAQKRNDNAATQTRRGSARSV